MSHIPCDKSPYSLHFNILKIMGAWVIKPKNLYHGYAYAIYKTVMTVVAVFASCSLFYDLFMVFGDFKKTTWNLCISTLFIASFLKNLLVLTKSSVVDALREGLHRDTLLKTAPEYEALHKLSMRELRLIQIFFYGLAGIFIPTWLITIYSGSFLYPKAMPIPLRLPVQIDVEDDFQYNLKFWLLGSVGVLGITLVLEMELAMFTILIQITREYKILLQDISKLDEMYESKRGVEEVNPVLRQTRTKSLMKEYSTRQQKLIEYTEEFELSYSPSLLLQVFAMTVLVVVSAIQCILEGSLSMNVTYQLGYMSIIMMDMFLVCWFATRIRTQCLKVGEEAYYTLWYRMSIDVQKDICMMIMRSQRPPKITSGKIMELNLHAFMHTLRNMYSWLALFNQLTQKVN